MWLVKVRIHIARMNVIPAVVNLQVVLTGICDPPNLKKMSGMHLNVILKNWQTSYLHRTDVKTFCGDAFGQINLSVAEFRFPKGAVSIRQNTFFCGRDP